MDSGQETALVPATWEPLRICSQGFENAPGLFMDMERFTPFRYDPDQIDARFDARRAAGNRVDFLILRGEAPIGELALEYAFQVLRLDRVLADVVLKNTGSQHVLEKVGFTYLRQEGIFRYYEFPRSRWEEHTKKKTAVAGPS